MSSKYARISVAELNESGEAELKTGPFGTQLKASEYIEAGTPVINVRNIGFGNIREDKLEYLGKDTVLRLSSHLLRSGDIVFGRKGAVERHVFIKDGQANWFQGSDCLRLRLSSNRIVPRFASYFFLTQEHQQWMMSQCSHGAIMASLNQDIISRIQLPAPPVGIQRRIASILSAYDDLIENNTRRITILEEMARRLYEEWFVRFRFPGHEQVRMVETELGLIPEGWVPSRLGEHLNIDKGVSYSGKGLTKTGNPMVNLKNVMAGGGFRRDGTKPYSGDFKPRHTVQPGDIVVANTDLTQAGHVVGSPAIIPKIDYGDHILITHHLYAVRLSERLMKNIQFVFQLMLSPAFKNFAKGHASGTTVLAACRSFRQTYQQSGTAGQI